MGEDHLVPGTPGWRKRQAVHTHNGYKGCAQMMVVQAQAIISSPTTTTETKQWAQMIQEAAHHMSIALNTRIDQE